MAAMAMIASALLSTSSAQQVTSVNANSAIAPSVQMQAKVKFIEAAFIIFEHEPFKLSNIIPLIDTEQTVTTQAFVSVKGLSGETVSMTCSVESDTIGTRDCDGSAQTQARSIMSGTRLDNNILLTDDLLPDPSGETAGSISIEVTYT